MNVTRTAGRPFPLATTAQTSLRRVTGLTGPRQGR